MDQQFERADHGLILSRRAAANGLHSHLLSARDRGELVPVRRGVYLPSDAHSGLDAEERHRAAAMAAALQRRRPVFAGFTAAVMAGLPVVGPVPAQVFLLAPRASGRRRNGVVELVRPGARLVETDGGLPSTSIADALIEVARGRPPLQALVMADAALHIPRLDSGGPLCTIDDLEDTFRQMLPFPGSRRVRAVLDRATTDSDSPLETLSRVRIEELGFPAPQVLQFPVLVPGRAAPYFLDLAWPDYAVWGEADGNGKYLGTGAGFARGRSLAQVVSDEKTRENQVRAATKWACGRWDWLEAWNGAPLRRILLEAGLPLVRPPSPWSRRPPLPLHLAAGRT